MKFIGMPDSWRRSMRVDDGAHTEQLLPPTRLATQEESEHRSEERSTESRSKPVRTGTRGLAIQLDAHGSWRAEDGSPWASINLSPETLGAYSQIAILGADASSARELAAGILRAGKRISKPKPTLMRRLKVREEANDIEELTAFAGFVNGFVVPADGATDPAVAFERTRRRVAAIRDSVLEAGWTQSPPIGIEVPNLEFLDRMAKGFADYIILRDPPKSGAMPAERVIVPVQPRKRPWWTVESQYFYMPMSNVLWWEDWMINPLTYPAVSE